MKKLALICLSLVSIMPIVFGSVSAKCDQNFYKTLRYGKQYTFRDEFNANSSDKWIWDYSVTSNEQYDYNKSTSFPEFDWTDEIVSADYKVPANKTMSVIKAKSPYQILQVPLQRSYDNLLLTYTIQYSTDEAGNHQYSHTECGHYAISRCGDGIVDDGGTHGGFATTDYGEVCDPKDESHTNWGVGGCTRDCQKDNTPQTYCGDGILQSNEDCDPGNGNFGNGCDSNCKLTTPTCTLTVNPNQGNAPLTTTINGTKPTWATYTNLSYGDGQSKANPTFSLNHTYTTVGSYSLTLTVQNNYNGQINGTRPTATCSASVQTSAAPYCGDGILQSNESCDPGNGNFGNGCDSNCKLTTPTCTLTVNPNQGNAPLTTTINGTKPTWATYTNLSYGDGQSKANPTFSLNHTYTTVGSYSLTLTVQNNYNGQINGTRPTATCSASVQTSAAPYCGDGILQSNESCDPGNGNFGNGCDSNCKLTTPTCTLTVNPNQGNAPLTTTINGTKPTWATYTNLSYGDGQSKANPTFSLNHTYTTVGSYSLTLTVQNNYNGQINGTRPTATCSASVQTSAVKDPECNSSYNGQRLTNLVEGNYLCSEGTYSNFQYNENTHKWAWKCNNVVGKSVNCSATKPYCGDGIKDAGEVCDYKDTTNKAGWGNGGCSNSCQPITINGPECNSSYNGQRLTNLVEGNYLCSEGTYGSFQYNENTHEWTWKCNNTLGQSVNCSAVKPYCGDGIKDAGEICDYRDTTNKAGWSELGCSNTCQPITVPSGCDETFYDKLRYGRQYTFYDDFHANSSDKWLWKWVMEYNEQYDYNMSPDFPAFAWTTNIVNANYRVAANTTMRVLQATSTYPILAVPAQRAYDNLFIKYTLTYSTDEAGANKVAHSECAYYEITWCGDGVLDTEFGETCDPKDPTHTGWGNRGCDDSCQPVISKGYLDPLKTLIGSNEVTKTGDIITWSLKVTAKDGDVTNFIMSDTLPPVLGYKDYEILHKGSVDNITLLGADDNSVSWRVDGTLKEGDYVEIKLITYAKEMPKQEQKNVLCVRPENEENDKKCDDEPIPPVCSSEYNGETLDELPSEDKLCEVGKATDVKYDENTHKWTWKCENEEGIGVSCSANKKQSSKGYLDPLKTLIGSNEVTKTGDIITWSLKVTAKDGDVTNFIMSDTLPPVLGYKDYEILHKGSVDNITLLGADDNSVSWRVDGTLKEGDYVEIKLITYAKEMPKQEQKNVLCVRPENEENDKKCDDEPIPPVCSSEYNGETLDELPSEDKLCEVGKATDVKYDENTHKWTWKCENEEGIGVSCSANKKQSSKGYLDPLKTLIGSNEVTKTGDIITWSLKVTAKDGDVTNFIMSDTLPPVLGYKDYEILHKGSVDNITLLGADDNSVSWRVDGTLKEGDYVEIKLITYAKEMPKQEQKNVLCVRPENEENDKKCDDEPIPPVCSSEYNGETLDELPSEDKLCEVGKATDVKYDSSTHKWTWKCENEEGIGVSCSANKEEPSERNPDIRIKKSFTDGSKTGKVVKIGDEIAYLIEFGNRGDAPATITMIKDFLPKNVDYISGDIFFDGGYSHNNTTGTEQIGTLRGIHFNRTVQGVYIDIYGGLTLEPNSTGHIILIGKVREDFTDNRTNFACIYLNDKQIDCDDATHDIVPEEVMCAIPTLDPPSDKVLEGEEVKGSTTVTCKSDGGDADTISIYCGKVSPDNLLLTKKNVSVASGVCEFSGKGDHEVRCEVNGSTKRASGDECKGVYNLSQHEDHVDTTPQCSKPGFSPEKISSNGENITVTCRAGVTDALIGIDCDFGGGRISEYNSDNLDYISPDKQSEFTKTCHGVEAGQEIACFVYAKGNWTSSPTDCMRYVEKSSKCEGDCSSGHDPDDNKNCEELDEKTRSETPVCNLGKPHCFNINAGNVSIEKGEYLPLYRNIEKDNFRLNDYVYTNNRNKDNACHGGDIELSSMKCTYIIRDPSNKRVYEKTLPCFGEEGVPQPENIVLNWAYWQIGEYGIEFGDKNQNRFEFNFGLTDSRDWRVGTVDEYRPNGPEIKDLGEYKVQLIKVTYYECTKDGWTQYEKEAVCGSNFILTEPYTVQKTPSGNLIASTKTLSNFKLVNGEGVFSDYLNAMSTTDYHRNDNVDKAIENFKNKYKKLAVAVKGDSSVKKVPGKNIYFVNKDFEIGGGTFKGAFTIIQEGGHDVTISGSVTNLNMMILTDGDITFKGSCKEDQTVKGIFIGKTLNRAGVENLERVEKNYSKSQNYWCNKGGLHIKGVLIGDNFENLMKNSRSHIDGWRKDETSRNNEDELKTKVMNGASVVIEYSPSIFTQSTMPPGAEYFTTALDIYKK